MRTGSSGHRAVEIADDDDLDPAIMAALIARFLDDAIDRCRALRAAVGNGEAAAVQEIGHYIKGGAAQFRVNSVRDLAAAVEALGRNGTLDSAPALVNVLESELVTARSAVAPPDLDRTA